MELLDRYLNAVRRHLPWLRQDDIIAELRANLEAQLEDKEAAAGPQADRRRDGGVAEAVGIAAAGGRALPAASSI